MHQEHILLCDVTCTGYLECLPLLHGQLAAVPCYEVIGAAVESLSEGWGCAAIPVRKRRRTLLTSHSWVNRSSADLLVQDDLRFIADASILRSDWLRWLVLLWVKMRWTLINVQHTHTKA